LILKFKTHLINGTSEDCHLFTNFENFYEIIGYTFDFECFSKLVIMNNTFSYSNDYINIVIKNYQMYCYSHDSLMFFNRKKYLNFGGVEYRNGNNGN